MRTVYEAYDGTHFENADDCFDYEWRERYPDLRIFGYDGQAVSSASDIFNFENIFKVNSPEEKKFVMDYLITYYGKVDFSDRWVAEHNGPNGYILEKDDEISFISREMLITFYNGELNPDSALAYDLEEEKA